MRLERCIVAALLAAFGAGFAAVAHSAPGHRHEHGIVRVDVAFDGPQLSLSIEAPLESLLGFERSPKTAAERSAAQALLKHLSSGDLLFQPDEAARCKAEPTEVTSPALTASGGTDASGGHADLQAVVTFACEQPQQLRAIRVKLFEAYRRIQRIDVRIASPAGQTRAQLRPASPVIVLKR